MLYSLTIDKYKWYIDTENSLLYSIPQFNKAQLTLKTLSLVKIFLKKESENDCIKGYTYEELAKKLGYQRTSSISKLIDDFCQHLNITHCIPIAEKIDRQRLLQISEQNKYYLHHDVEEIKNGIDKLGSDKIEANKLLSIQRNEKESRANLKMHLIFSLLSKYIKIDDVFFKTKKGVYLPFINIEYKGCCPFSFPLTIDKKVKKTETNKDSLYNQRNNSGRIIYNGRILCLENENDTYSLGKTTYMDVLDSCDYFPSKIKEYWVENYESIISNNLSIYLNLSIDRVFDKDGELDRLLLSDIYQNVQRDNRGLYIHRNNHIKERLNITLKNDIKSMLQGCLKKNLDDQINMRIKLLLEDDKISLEYPLKKIINEWTKRIEEIKEKKFSNYVAGLAFSVPLFQITQDGIKVLLAKGSSQKANGAGTKHVVPAGMMEFFSDVDPEYFSFDDFKALVCKEMLEELYFGTNIVHQQGNNFYRTITLFSDNKDERTLASYQEILDKVKNEVIKNWNEIWKACGKEEGNIPSKVLLETILDLKEDERPWFLVVDALNGRPEIIKPIYFKENVDIFLNWENVSSELIAFSNQDELEYFIEKYHWDFCAPGIASIYLGARYYFQNKDAINEKLEL